MPDQFNEIVKTMVDCFKAQKSACDTADIDFSDVLEASIAEYVLGAFSSHPELDEVMSRWEAVKLVAGNVLEGDNLVKD